MRRLVRTFSLAAALAAATLAAPRAQSREVWTCTADRGWLCSSAACTALPDRAEIRIDFDARTYRLCRGAWCAPARTAEVDRRPGRVIVRPGPGVTFQARTGSRSFAAVRFNGLSVRVRFGRCRVETRKPA